MTESLWLYPYNYPYDKPLENPYNWMNPYDNPNESIPMQSLRLNPYDSIPMSQSLRLNLYGNPYNLIPMIIPINKITPQSILLELLTFIF